MPLRLPHPASVLHAMASQCAVCRSWPAHRVCAPCVARFAQAQARCRTCALALPADLSLGLGTPSTQCANCVRQAPPLNACFAAATYAYPWSGLMADYKYGQDPAWAVLFADLLLRMPGVSDALTALQDGDWLIPMPLSAARLQTRGFNQAWELTKALARHSGSAAASDAQLLLRIRNTPSQAALQREARLRNVKGAFALNPLRAAELQDRRIVLVDDVMTSGASLFTAAQVLRDAGAAHITGVVFARTPAPTVAHCV